MRPSAHTGKSWNKKMQERAAQKHLKDIKKEAVEAAKAKRKVRYALRCLPAAVRGACRPAVQGATCERRAVRHGGAPCSGYGEEVVTDIVSCLQCRRRLSSGRRRRSGRRKTNRRALWCRRQVGSALGRWQQWLSGGMPGGDGSNLDGSCVVLSNTEDTHGRSRRDKR